MSEGKKHTLHDFRQGGKRASSAMKSAFRGVGSKPKPNGERKRLEEAAGYRTIQAELSAWTTASNKLLSFKGMVDAEQRREIETHLAQAEGKPWSSFCNIATRRATLLLMLGDLDGAIAALKPFPAYLVKGDGQDHRGDVIAVIWLASLYLQKGRLPEAETLYRQVVEFDPEHVVAWNSLGHLHAQKGQPVEAESCLREAFALDPKNAVTRNSLGHLYAQTGRLEEAEALFRESLVLYPGNMVTLNSLGNLCAQTGRAAEAEELFRESLVLYPGNVVTLNSLGALCAQMGRREEAEEIFRKTLALQPRNVVARHALGNLLVRKGNVGFAEKMFREILEEDPENRVVWGSLANLRMKQKRFREAGECLEKALVGLQKDDNAALYLQAKLAFLTGDLAQCQKLTQPAFSAAFRPRNKGLIILHLASLPENSPVAGTYLKGIEAGRLALAAELRETVQKYRAEKAQFDDGLLVGQGEGDWVPEEGDDPSGRGDGQVSHPVSAVPCLSGLALG